MVLTIASVSIHACLEWPTSRPYNVSKRPTGGKGVKPVCGNVDSEAADRLTAVREPPNVR